MCDYTKNPVNSNKVVLTKNVEYVDKDQTKIIVEKIIPPTFEHRAQKITNNELVNNLLTKDVECLEAEHKKLMIEKSVPATSDLYRTFNIPERFDWPYRFQGYGIQGKRKNPFYKTVNSEYGYYFPNAHTVPTRFYPRQQKFSVQLAKAGLYRNYSLNTQSDQIQFSTKIPTQNNLTCRK